MANAVQSRNPSERKHLTAERLREVLSYDPETGAFTWLVSTSNRSPKGSRAGYVRSDRYIVIRVDGFLYLAHRLAFLWMVGDFPCGQVDHRDTDKGNNRWDNLREANNGQNKANTSRRKDNTSGFKGVTYDKTRANWQARVSNDGRTIHLGRFSSPEDAYVAYCTKANEIYGEFARLS